MRGEPSVWAHLVLLCVWVSSENRVCVPPRECWFVWRESHYVSFSYAFLCVWVCGLVIWCFFHIISGQISSIFECDALFSPSPLCSISATHCHGDYELKLAQNFMEWHFSLSSISAPSTQFAARAFCGFVQLLSHFCSLSPRFFSGSLIPTVSVSSAAHICCQITCNFK